MRYRALSVLILMALAAGSACAQPQSASGLVEKAWRKFGAINDYSADVRLDMRGDKVSIKGLAMKFYYKKPGKTRMVAQQGFAAMPRNVLLGNPLKELSKNTRASLLRSEKKNGADCYVVQFDPSTPSQGAQSVLVWLEKSRLLIRATSLLGPQKLDTVWTYTRVDAKYDLPSKITAEVLVPGEPATRLTRAVVTFRNYRVNKGISDSVFRDTGKTPAQSTHRPNTDPDQ